MTIVSDITILTISRMVDTINPAASTNQDDVQSGGHLQNLSKLTDPPTMEGVPPLLPQHMGGG